MFKKKKNSNTSENKRPKLFERISPKEVMTEEDKKAMKTAFNVLAIVCIALFCFSITPKYLQNDTFYTIKIGQLIRQNGIDYIDHFSWHENLPYMYPHWLYDVLSSYIYDYCNGFLGIYISTVVVSIIFGIAMYLTGKKICKSETVAFAITIGQVYLLRNYVAARAQLVTFVLFTLTILFIEKFLEKPKIKYAIVLILIPTLIANIHSAVFPFYFVLYLPYIGEYILRLLLDWHLAHKIYQIYLNKMIKYTNKRLKKVEKEKAEKYQKKLAYLNKCIEESNKKFDKFVAKQNSRRKNPDKVRIERNDNTLKLMGVMLICLFTGLLTPLKDMPYTYTWRIIKGNTTKSVSEHLPLTLIDNKPLFISLTGTIAVLAFTKVKIRIRDLLFISGLTLLAFMSRRQVSMLVIFGGFVLDRMITEILEFYDKKGLDDLIKYMTSISGEILTIILIFSLCYIQYKPNMKDAFINESSYPVEAAKWMNENMNVNEIKLFNDYNYGSYLLFKDIPVFIDSRCDLYTPEFNGEYNKERKKFDGQDIFSDYMNISSLSTYYENKFKEYGITHVITKDNSKINMFLSRDEKGYKQLYKDNNFVIYERIKEDNNEENKE